MALGVAADRKTHASIHCVPLLGVSLEAAQELHRRVVRQKSDWLIPQYASEIGNTSEFARYGSVGYRLEQKKAVIERILV